MVISMGALWNQYKSGIQVVATTLGVLVIVGSWALNQHDAYADERYVLKGELKATIEALDKNLDQRSFERENEQLENLIVDLEDDIIWFSENDGLPSALRRCRKLTRAVRDWNDIHPGEQWKSDRVVEGVCGGAS